MVNVAAMTTPPVPMRGSRVLTVGFGTTVAMWGIGYLSRLPALQIPSPIVLFLLLACLFMGGLVMGRYGDAGWRLGAAAGLVSGLLNLMVLGSFLAGERPNEVVPSAFLWLPGSILVAAVLVGVGAAVGTRWYSTVQPCRDWSGAFAQVGIAAALLLLGVGGLVTSAEAGLAVVDWPNSFGYNMFLYPFSRMTGGIYYEHAHRLFGGLVGLTTLVFAIQLQLRERRRWVRRLGWFAMGLVIVQGVLGGLRVTGGFTLSTSPDAMRPSIALAMTHGVLGQLFFATLVALGAFTSTTWRGAAKPVTRETANADRMQAGLLVGLVALQLVLGAAQRHLSGFLLVHIVFGVALVAPLAVHVGFRSWGLSAGQPLLRRLGQALVGAIGFQLLLGLAAYVATAIGAHSAEPSAAGILLATAHQWFGAVLLGLAVLLLCWDFRLLGPGAPAAGDPPSSR